MNFFRNFLFLVVPLALAGCSTKKAAPPPFEVRFDAKKILSLEEARENEKTAPVPALYGFKAHGKSLWFLAGPPTDTEGSPSSVLINWVFENRPVDLVIIEGFPTDAGTNPTRAEQKGILRILDRATRSGDAEFARALAKERNIPVLGGEPNEAYRLKTITDSALTLNDLLAFEFVQQCPVFAKDDAFKGKKPEKIYSAFMKDRAKAYKATGPTFTFEQFKKWYAANQGKPFSLATVKADETEAIEGTQLTRNIAVELAHARDEHLLATIAREMNKPLVVFAVVEGARYRVQHEALKDVFGEPAEKMLPKEKP